MVVMLNFNKKHINILKIEIINLPNIWGGQLGGTVDRLFFPPKPASIYILSVLYILIYVYTLTSVDVSSQRKVAITFFPL